MQRPAQAEARRDARERALRGEGSTTDAMTFESSIGPRRASAQSFAASKRSTRLATRSRAASSRSRLVAARSSKSNAFLSAAIAIAVLTEQQRAGRRAGQTGGRGEARIPALCGLSSRAGTGTPRHSATRLRRPRPKWPRPRRRSRSLPRRRTPNRPTRGKLPASRFPTDRPSACLDCWFGGRP